MTNTYDVDLFVYDISQGMAKTLGPLLLRKNIEAIWHTGVVVYGREYFFGSSGIQFVDPGGTILGHTYKILKMGKTEVTVEIFEDYLRGLASEEFREDNYHLMDHNCNTFSDAVVSFLLHKHIPQHILNLPKQIQETQIGVFLRPMLDNLYRGQKMFGGQGTSLQNTSEVTSSASAMEPAKRKDTKTKKKNKNNKNTNNFIIPAVSNDIMNDMQEEKRDGSISNYDKEVEERKLKIAKVLKDTLKKFSEDGH